MYDVNDYKCDVQITTNVVKYAITGTACLNKGFRPNSSYGLYSKSPAIE